ncbi:hypothetical protein [Alteribacter keqinensis]|uniref:Uncharacterized protein n=1 Tax=Alteribacter keqinensis TaxID=2483800 RepID=A0A3M7TS31_9BACI|nr:hypothetical protein [Alteribacter keqinensis]RNA67110.1 hypothetical protein EBO34_18145 [Alteribacter keqinensis]
MDILFTIFYFSVFMLILFLVIEVRKGINRSNLGRYLEEKHGIKEEEESFLNRDLDDEERK